MILRGELWGKRRLGRRIAGILLLGAGFVAVLCFGFSARLVPADFAFANDVEVSSLDPATATGISEGRVSRFLFEGLCIHDPKSLAILPGAAESWDVSADGKGYTFHIRENALWSNGDRLTARDFAWSFERLLDPRTAAEYAYQLWPVKGAQRFTTDVDDGGRPTRSFDSVAIRAANENTLAIELTEPLPYFLDILAMPALAPVNRKSIEAARARFPETWSSEWMKPEHLVTNGPYTLELRRVNDRIRFAKNPRYWDAEHVAFRTVDALAVEHVSTMLNLYLTGEIGWADNAPASLIPRLMPREDFHPAPYLATSFYRINVTRPPFDDKRVRRALALAIDRAAITQKVTKAGELAAWSFVPPCVREQSGTELAERTELPHCTDRATPALCTAADVAEARRLIAEAGFGPGATPLPSVEIHYNTQSNNKDVAEVIADSWRRNLGLDVKFTNQEWKVYLDAQKRLDYEVSRSSWIGDHPDPLGFLEIFGSGNENNRTGWSNARYDDLLARAHEARGDERSVLLREAEALLLDELPILPIYFFVAKNLVDPRLGGFHENALDEHPPKFWYWMDDAELESKREMEFRAEVIAAKIGSSSTPDVASSELPQPSIEVTSTEFSHRGDADPVVEHADFLGSSATPGESAPVRRGTVAVESHGPPAGLYSPAHEKLRPKERP